MVVQFADLIAIRQDSIDDKLSPRDISIMFNEFLIAFERMQNRNGLTRNIFVDAVEEIVDAVLLILPYKLLNPKLLHHPLMYFLHQMFITVLDTWRVPPIRLNIQEMDIFLKIVLIFVHAAEQVPEGNTDEDRKRMKDVLTMKQFLFNVREQIDDLILKKQRLDDDRNIYVLGLLTITLLRDSPFYYEMGRNEPLISNLVMNSLDSYDFNQAMNQLLSGKQLPDIDYYHLFICWKNLSSISLAKQDPSIRPTSTDLIHYVCDELLTRLENDLDELPPTATPALTYIFERCHQLVTIHNLPSFNKHASNIINRLTKVLQNSLPTNTHEDVLIVVVLEAFYNLSKNTDIRTIIKQRHLTSLFFKYTSTEMGAEKRKLAFSILAQIMDEQEINDHASEITTFFIDQLKQLDPNGYNPNVDCTLSSLKALMQYEQIKTGFVKQDGLETIISFIRDGDPNKQSDKQLEDALEILWACAFNNPEALNTLKQDDKLMTRVNHLLENAKHNENSTLQKAAEGLIWKVEKEEKFKQHQVDEAERKLQEKKRKAQETGIEEDEEEEEHYDCMLSYSWADMDLAHRIVNHLTEKLGYKVWLDQEQMHGSTIEAMANAVENAQFILMCMSDTYKQSANCQSEAEYAFNRKKHIVPIKMKKDFVADGWLGFILGTRMYIDFGTHEFDKAIELLDNEIQSQKKKRKEAKEMARAKKKIEVDNRNDEDTKEKDQDHDQKVEDKVNVDDISSWNKTMVRDFLTNKDLSDFLPLCNGINGEELLDLYRMCRNGSVTMYRLLKFELLNGHQKDLPISTFLHFIDRLRAIIKNHLASNRYIYNENLTEYSEDDEENFFN